ncbi:hypothetical protein DCAR_0520470 [Daucus carota subsp. sativus]|uniref:Uncharacterized protein n=1 Tax=Daucus carota subsp. sativus TaxID=79200 RepID=A0A162A3E2_DAUCS|nr:hypothetical protein DCAR_0520470 [Daucus carota subsp. sativus]
MNSPSIADLILEALPQNMSDGCCHGAVLAAKCFNVTLLLCKVDVYQQSPTATHGTHGCFKQVDPSFRILMQKIRYPISKIKSEFLVSCARVYQIASVAVSRCIDLFFVKLRMRTMQTRNLARIIPVSILVNRIVRHMVNTHICPTN